VSCVDGWATGVIRRAAGIQARATFRRRPRPRIPVPPLWPRPRAGPTSRSPTCALQSVARLGCPGRGRGFRRARCKGLDDLGPGPSRTWPSRPAPLTPTWPSKAHPWRRPCHGSPRQSVEHVPGLELGDGLNRRECTTAARR